jgi:hypothetical protein
MQPHFAYLVAVHGENYLLMRDNLLKRRVQIKIDRVLR